MLMEGPPPKSAPAQNQNMIHLSQKEGGHFIDCIESGSL